MRGIRPVCNKQKKKKIIDKILDNNYLSLRMSIPNTLPSKMLAAKMYNDKLRFVHSTVFF